MRRLMLPAAFVAALFALLLAGPAWTRPQEFEPPTDKQKAEMSDGDLWGWIIECENKARKDVLVDLVKIIHADEKRKEYIEGVWNAIWNKMVEAEDALKSDPESDGYKRQKANNVNYLKFYGAAIEEAIGNASFKDRIAEWTALDPKLREQKAWALKRLKAAEDALTRENDASSALQRAEAGWNAIKEIGDKHWMHRFLAFMADCNIKLKKTPTAFEQLTKAKALAEENKDAEFVERYTAKMKEIESSGAATERSALDEKDAWDTSTEKGYDKGWKTYAFAPGPPKPKDVPFRFPTAYSRHNPFFWKQVYLKDDRKGNVGGKLGAEKIGIPGQHWLVKEPGKHEAKLTSDPSKPGGTKFKAGPTPQPQRFRATYPNPKPGKSPIQLDYWFEVANPMEVRIWNQKTTVSNPPDLLDLRVRPLSWRVGRGPEGQPVTLVDGNFNGQFGVVWEGQIDEYKDVGMDGILCGRGKKGTLFSPLVRCGKGFYLCDPQKNSLKIDFRKFVGKTGKVKLTLRGLKGKPTWVILSMPFSFKRGTREVNATALIDISDAVKIPVELPSGSWKLHYGLISDGNNEDKSARVEIKPGTYPAIDVPKDPDAPPVEVVLGGKLLPVVDAVFNEGSSEVIVKTDSFRAYGENGEIYHSIWPEPLKYKATVMDDRGPVFAGSARKWTEMEAKPTHAAMAFAKPVQGKPKRRPMGSLWVRMQASDKILGKLVCNAKPEIPTGKKPAEEKPTDEKKADEKKADEKKADAKKAG